MANRDELIGIVLDGAFRGRGWQGPTLLGSLRGVTLDEAGKRPAPGRHCIWEHVLHAAYWKYAILRALRGDADDAFPRKPANWPQMPARPTLAHWKRDIALLKDLHECVVEAALAVPTAKLHRIPATPRGENQRTWTHAQYIAGSAAHDQYHCGQIQLIKRLIRAGGA